MVKILVCKHVPPEGLDGFEAFLAELGVEYHYQELYHDAQPRDLASYQALIVMGGPMNAYEENKYPLLKTSLGYLETAVKSGLPVLGFCLGAQLLSRVLGGEVSKNPLPELGWYPLQRTEATDPLFAGFPGQFPVFQWHQDTFTIPPGGKLLATASGCHNQAFSWNETAFGLQFHLEVGPSLIREWLRDEATVNAWGFKPASVITDTDNFAPVAAELGKRLCANFAEIIQQRRSD